MKKIMRSRSSYIYILLGLLAIIVLSSSIPGYRIVPSRDSGVFLYLGQQILDGKIPYLDVWDHKGPGIYYINAFGLFLGRGSLWGVWFLEFLSLYIAVLLGYIVMSQAFGRVPALFASIIWLISLVFVLEEGNFTEEFALPIQFAALYLFWRSQKTGLRLWHTFLIGVTFALSFSLRPNNVGVQVAIGILIILGGILSPRRSNVFWHISALFFGAIIIILPIVIYFTWNNASSELFDSIFRYNSMYSTSTFKKKIESVFNGLELYMRSGITITALSAWTVGCFSILSGTRQPDKRTFLLYLGLIGLPIELLLSSVSGRAYGHYYITWLPILAILTGFFAFEVLSNFTPPEVIFLKRKIGFGSVWLFALLISMDIVPLRQQLIPPVARLFLSNAHERPSLTERIRSYAAKDDYLIMWGAETTFNFLAQKPAPSRFVYQYPLYTCGYYTEEMIEEFLDDLMENKPLIVDTSSTNNFIPPIDDDKREKWLTRRKDKACLSPKMDDVFKFIRSNYTIAEIIRPNQWTIYKYADSK